MKNTMNNKDSHASALAAVLRRAAGLLLLFLATSAAALAADPALPPLRVSDNHRFLVAHHGAPFFWLGDTAWHMFGKVPARTPPGHQPTSGEPLFLQPRRERASPSSSRSSSARPTAAPAPTPMAMSHSRIPTGRARACAPARTTTTGTTWIGALPRPNGTGSLPGRAAVLAEFHSRRTIPLCMTHASHTATVTSWVRATARTNIYLGAGRRSVADGPQRGCACTAGHDPRDGRGSGRRKQRRGPVRRPGRLASTLMTSIREAAGSRRRLIFIASRGWTST